jgi:hypothetical protein
MTKHFEKMTSGNVLAEILREVEKANGRLRAGDSVGCGVHLEYVETIVNDACEQYGANAVFGVMEISKLAP